VEQLGDFLGRIALIQKQQGQGPLILPEIALGFEPEMPKHPAAVRLSE